jgi:L-ribulose-5-phosphate 4-epimerase
MDEGVIKFNANWTKRPAFPQNQLEALIEFRQLLFEQKLIGVYSNGIGYGNISFRINDQSQFFISGSGTGALTKLTPEHFSKVTAVHLAQNSLHCEGPVIASSESMSHYAFYLLDKAIGAVIHVHNRGMWDKLLNKVPTTPKSALYGTPEMANAIQDLWLKEHLKECGIVVMEGHPEGIFTFGKDLSAAYTRLQDAIQRLDNQKFL